MDYVFMTDSSCDMPDELCKKACVEVLPMEFEMEGKCYQHYPDCRMMNLDEFYTKLKGKVDVTTTQINYNFFVNSFEPYLKAGKDILYTGISTGLSGTYNTCLIAVNELKEKYPDRKIVVIDSRCDSSGLGYLIYMAGKKYVESASIEELSDYIINLRDSICHWFIVNDLDRLKRGGRISAVTATFGKALQIKPLISCDEVGHLVNVGKIRGTSNIPTTLIKLLKRDSVDLKHQTVFVAHADNKEGAEDLQKKIKGLCKDTEICAIGPVVGSHVGSGMLALIFLGNRNLKA